MLSGIARGLGRFALLAATAAFLAAASLFVFGSYLIMWPVLRKSPRNRRLQATAEFAAAGMTAMAAFAPDPDDVA